MTLQRIVMRLARNPDAPEGDDSRGYVLIAPLDADGHIDLEAWRAQRQLCTVDRFDPDPDLRADGWLTHRGSQWRFRYDEDHEGPDEGGFQLGEHEFRPGAYVTITFQGETPLTYIVTEVAPYHPPKGV